MAQYTIAAWLIGVGIVLWAVTAFWHRTIRHEPTGFARPEELAEHKGDAPRN
jgi:hypothetical protein